MVTLISGITTFQYKLLRIIDFLFFVLIYKLIGDIIKYDISGVVLCECKDESLALEVLLPIRLSSNYNDNNTNKVELHLILILLLQYKHIPVRR